MPLYEVWVFSLITTDDPGLFFATEIVFYPIGSAYRGLIGVVSHCLFTFCMQINKLFSKEQRFFQ